MNIFSDLESYNIQYIVWKDIYKASEFFEGNAELDLLVNFDQNEQFEEIISNRGFIPLKINSFLNRRGIKHFIRYLNGKYFHLHVYYGIITGNHFVKEYEFHIEKSLFSNYVLENNIKLASKELEVAFLIIRLNIKKSSLIPNIKIKEVNRLATLSENCNKLSVMELISIISPKIKASICELLSLALEKKRIPKKQRIILKEFNSFQTLKGFRYAYKYISIRIFLIYLRLNKSSNKTFMNEGVSFALLGCDGSGKTTIASKLFKQYRAKTSCKKFYLGGNFKTYSLATWVAYFNYYLMRVFSPFKEKYYLAWFLYYTSFIILELGKAYDRKRKVIKGEKLKSKGWIVIYERFPIGGLFDFPTHLLDIKKHIWFPRKSSKIIRFLLQNIEHTIKYLDRPDTSFLITTNLEKMKERRTLADNEIIDIDRKLKTQRIYLLNNEADLVVINNNQELKNVISLINQEINNKICISSL
ncbi:hypothetical protein N8666_00445 [bacterium]|nr:hypothetical protein [bacterium]